MGSRAYDEFVTRRSTRRGPEKAVTDALGILLIAERAAMLSGRDDEFVAILKARGDWGGILSQYFAHQESGVVA